MRYHYIKQHDISDCGPACIATVLRYYGLKVSLSYVREIAGTDKEGTNIYGMIQALQSLGFVAKGVKGDKNAFLNGISLPCIAHVILKGNILHYIVIYKITKKYIIVADPGKGIVKISLNSFLGIEQNENKIPEYIWSGVLILLTPTESFPANTSNTEGLFHRFFFLIKPHKMLFVKVSILSFFISLFGIIGSYYYKILMDDLLPKCLINELFIVSVGAIFLIILKVLLIVLRAQLLLYLSQKIDIDLLLGYYKHVIELPMSVLESRRSGELLSRYQDASKVRDALSSVVLTIMIDSLMAVAGGIILYLQNPILFFLSVAILIIYFIVVFSFNHYLKELNEIQMEDNAQLTSHITESLSGIQTIKENNIETDFENTTNNKLKKCLQSVFKLGTVSNIQNALVISIELIGEIVILWCGGLEVISGRMTLGQLISFNALLGYFLSPVKNLINLQPQMQGAIVAAERLGEIFDIEIEKKIDNYKKNVVSLCGDIQIKNITFRYGTRKPIFNDFSLEIKSGEKIAFVGESGSGKTTLAKLLIGLYPLSGGSICIAENCINEIPIDFLRKKISYISQEAFWFSGSIRENLVLGLPNITDNQIIDAIKKVQAFEFINDF